MMQTVLPACSVVPGPLCDGADFLMFDNFPGEVSATNGKAPIIGSGTWSVTGGSAANARSGNGNLTLDVPLTGNAYAQIALGEVPGEIGCTFEYVGPLPDPDDGRPTPTLACYQSFDTFPQNNFHFLAGRHVLSWTYWKDGVPGIQPAWQTLNLYALSPNSFYTYRILIDPPYTFGFLFDSAGMLIAHIAVNEPNMATVIGQYMFAQLFDAKLNYRSVWARRKCANSYAQASIIRGAALHVGTGKPSGILSARYDGSWGYPAPKIATSKGDAELQIGAESAGYKARLVLSTTPYPSPVTAASVGSGGANYQVDDVLTVQGGTVYPGVAS